MTGERREDRPRQRVTREPLYSSTNGFSPERGERPSYTNNENRREGSYNSRPRNDYGQRDSYRQRDNYGQREGYGQRNSDRTNNPFRSQSDRPSFNNRDNRGGYDRPQSRDQYNNDRGDYEGRNFGDRGNNDRGFYDRNSAPRHFNDRPQGERSFGDRPYGSRPQGERSFGDRPYGSRPQGERFDQEDRPQYRSNNGYDRPQPRDRYNSDRSFGDRPQGERSFGNRQGGYNNNRRPSNNRSGYGSRPNPNGKYSKIKQQRYYEENIDPNAPMRLNKYIANSGVCSRREADEFILAGVVKVNGEVVTEMGRKVLRSDNITFHDQPLTVERKVYILLNKQKNCVTTAEDPEGRKTVMDFVRNACAERIYPVGRLDRNTTGVLLLTNDGELATKLAHPKFNKKKIYQATLDRDITIEDMQHIADGVELEDGEIHADAISYVTEADKTQVGIEIHSGRNRVVRRLFDHLGYRVKKLDRVYFAGLTKKNVPRGKWRFLTEQEVNMLRMGSFE